MGHRTDLLVVGAGPYAYSAAACARDAGIDTTVVGVPMSFWREQMPSDMFLRSGPDWHLDPAGEHTFAAYFEDRGLRPADHDPVPIGVFLDHTDWFREQKGFDVTAAPGGAEALRVLSGATFDLVLLDVMMPEVDGFTVCRKIKDDPRLKDIPVIFLTAKGGGDALAEGFESGAVMYINKPFTANKLLTIVNTMLESGSNLT